MSLSESIKKALNKRGDCSGLFLFFNDLILKSVMWFFTQLDI